MKRAFRWLVTICVISILLPITLLWLCYTAPVQLVAKEILTRHLTRNTGHTVEVGSLRLRFPLKLTMDKVSVGTIGTLQHLETAILPFPLLHGEISTSRLTIEQLSLHTDSLIRTIEIDGTLDHIQLDDIAYMWKRHAIQANHFILADGEVAISANTQSTTRDSIRANFPLDIRINQISLSAIGWAYSNGKMSATASIAELQTDSFRMDTAMNIALGSTTLDDTSLHYHPTINTANAWALSDLRALIDSAYYSPAEMGIALTHLTLPDGISSLPSIPQQVPSFLVHSPLHTTIDIKSRHDTLNIRRCILSFPQLLDIEVTGQLSSLTNSQQLSADISYQLHTENQTFRIAVPNTGHAAVIPRHTNCRGEVHYTPDTMYAKSIISLSDGYINLTASYRPSARRYSIEAALHTLDLRQLTSIEQCGITTLQANLYGEGFNFRDASTTLYGNIRIDSLQWDAHTYTNAQLTAMLEDRQLRASCTYSDTLLHLHASAIAWYSPQEIRARLYANVSDIHLQALHVTTEELHPSFRCHMNFVADSASHYSLHGMIREIVFTSPQRITPPQDLKFHLTASTEDISFDINSNDLYLTFNAATYEPAWQWQFPADMKTVDYTRYLSQLHATLTIGNDNPLSHYLMLNGFNYHSIQGVLNDIPQGLSIQIKADSLSYRGIVVDTLSCVALYTPDSLHAQLTSSLLTWSTPTMILQAAIGANLLCEGFTLDKLSGTVSLGNVSYSFPSYSLQLKNGETQYVTFSNGRIGISDLRLYANNAQPLSLNGHVTLNGNTPTLLLRLTAQDTNLLQSTHTPQTLLYGSAILRGQVTLEGNINALSLNGNLALRAGSSIHYVYKDAILAAGNQIDDVVTFTSFEQHDMESIATPYRQSFLNLSANIGVSIAPTAEIDIMIGASGQNTGTIQGGGSLSLQYTPTSGPRLSGRYTIESGRLNMNVPLLHVHQMEIRSGSTIQWTGDITNPILDITAEDRIRASVTLDGEPQSVLFVTGLSISDTVDKLNVLFTLTAPENASMQNTLATLSTDERNKLAVALLTTGLYLGEGGTGNLMNTALLSFLQSQLDNISRDAFRTVDVSVGIEPLPDGVSGVSTRTDYTYSIAKRFWNDRIRVIIGGSVTTSNERVASDAIISNISIEWRISPNGSQYLRFFYDTDYKSILEGEIRETGIGYAYRRKF